MVVLTWQASVTVAAAEPLYPLPAVPVPVPGAAPNNHAATPSQSVFGLLPPPRRGGMQISAGIDGGHSARIGGGMTGGLLEDPRGLNGGIAP
ncbi:hypothetical protein FZI91_00170 [Mycobacterium sp. CBMA271]|nr:hypothetical protein [Mycobacteroides sp. CBMA 271]